MENEPPPPPAEEPEAEGSAESLPPRSLPPVGEKSAEQKALDRARLVSDLRALIDFVCVTRFGRVPPDVAALLAKEKNLALLGRWYIGAGSLSVEDLTAMVHAPRPEEQEDAVAEAAGGPASES